MIIATIVLFLLDIYLLIEALNSVELLNKTRRNINLINLGKITDGRITTNGTIINGIYNNQKINNNTIVAINNQEITDGQITDGTITNGEITGATITGATITDATITGAIITGVTINTEITDATITGVKITGATIELAQINEITPGLAITFIWSFALAIGAIVGAIVGGAIVLLLRDNGWEEIVRSLSNIFCKNHQNGIFKDHLTLFGKIVLSGLAIILLYSQVPNLPVPKLCITNPRENTKFLMRSPVYFEGKAYGDIKTLKISADGHKMSDKLLVTENKWNFPYSFKNVGDRQITIEGMNAADEVIAEQKVKITII